MLYQDMNLAKILISQGRLAEMQLAGSGVGDATRANSRAASIEHMGIIKLPTLQPFPNAARRRSLIYFSTPSTILFFFLNPLCINCTTKAASSRVIFISIFISDLSSGFTTPNRNVKSGPHVCRLFLCLPVLPAFLEAGIQVRADDTLV
jgi:hypothetical protein